MKKTFVFLLLIFITQICFAQSNFAQSNNVELIDKFGRINCEDDSARADQIAIRLQNNPEAKGYVVIYWENEDKDKLRKYFYEQRLKNYLYIARGIDESRIEFLRGENTQEREVEFWIAGSKNDKPEFALGKWNYELPNKRAFMIYTTLNDSGVCSSPFSRKLYTDFLLANTDRRGHIVITGNPKEFKKTKDEISKDLFDVYKISPKRIKFFFVKDNAYGDYTSEEYWFVRSK